MKWRETDQSMALSDTNHYTLWETGRTEEKRARQRYKKFVIIDVDTLRHGTLEDSQREPVHNLEARYDPGVGRPTPQTVPQLASQSHVFSQ